MRPRDSTALAAMKSKQSSGSWADEVEEELFGDDDGENEMRAVGSWADEVEEELYGSDSRSDSGDSESGSCNMSLDHDVKMEIIMNTVADADVEASRYARGLRLLIGGQQSDGFGRTSPRRALGSILEEDEPVEKKGGEADVLAANTTTAKDEDDETLLPGIRQPCSPEFEGRSLYTIQEEGEPAEATMGHELSTSSTLREGGPPTYLSSDGEVLAVSGEEWVMLAVVDGESGQVDLHDQCIVLTDVVEREGVARWEKGVYLQRRPSRLKQKALRRMEGRRKVSRLLAHITLRTVDIQTIGRFRQDERSGVGCVLLKRLRGEHEVNRCCLLLMILGHTLLIPRLYSKLCITKPSGESDESAQATMVQVSVYLFPREGLWSWRIPLRGPRDEYRSVYRLSNNRRCTDGETKMRCVLCRSCYTRNISID